MEIMFDDGIRSGQDVMRALALGAKSCMIGRAYIHGPSAPSAAVCTENSNPDVVMMKSAKDRV